MIKITKLQELHELQELQKIQISNSKSSGSGTKVINVNNSEKKFRIKTITGIH